MREEERKRGRRREREQQKTSEKEQGHTSLLVGGSQVVDGSREGAQVSQRLWGIITHRCWKKWE